MNKIRVIIDHEKCLIMREWIEVYVWDFNNLYIYRYVAIEEGSSCTAYLVKARELRAWALLNGWKSPNTPWSTSTPSNSLIFQNDWSLRSSSTCAGIVPKAWPFRRVSYDKGERKYSPVKQFFQIPHIRKLFTEYHNTVEISHVEQTFQIFFSILWRDRILKMGF